MTIIGYCRVSTKMQINNNSLEQQESEILDKYKNAIIYKEQFTAAKKERPIFSKILNKLKGGDTLVVTKLDRLARNTIEGIEIIENLFNRNISVHVLNVGLLENTSMGKFFITTLLAVAELERNMIIERTNVGKEIAKQRAKEQNLVFKEGRPKKFTQKQINHALSLKQTHSYREIEEITGISVSSLVRFKRENKVKELNK